MSNAPLSSSEQYIDTVHKLVEPAIKDLIDHIYEEARGHIRNLKVHYSAPLTITIDSGYFRDFGIKEKM